VKKAQEKFESSAALPAFVKIAKLIAPKNMPPWLPAHLEWWHQGLTHDRIVDRYRPTKLQTRERLEALEKAALLLKRELTHLKYVIFLKTLHSSRN
jgi:hypothetical protein